MSARHKSAQKPDTAAIVHTLEHEAAKLTRKTLRTFKMAARDVPVPDDPIEIVSEGFSLSDMVNTFAFRNVLWTAFHSTYPEIRRIVPNDWLRSGVVTFRADGDIGRWVITFQAK